MAALENFLLIAGIIIFIAVVGVIIGIFIWYNAQGASNNSPPAGMTGTTCVPSSAPLGPVSQILVNPPLPGPSCTSSSNPPIEQTAAFRVTNQFDFPIWVQSASGDAGLPMKALSDENLFPWPPPNGVSNEEYEYWVRSSNTYQIPPGGFLDYNVDPRGVAGTRFWGKFACNSCCSNPDNTSSAEVCGCLPPYPVGCAVAGSSVGPCQIDSTQAQGTECLIGDSAQYTVPPISIGGECNPQATPPCGAVGGCPSRGCSVPADSLFEATFACTETDTSKCNINPSAPANDPTQRLGPSTFFDTSLVDGYSLPFKVLVKGSAAQLQKCINSNTGGAMEQEGGNAIIDGSGLDVDNCPTSTNLESNTGISSVTDTDQMPPLTYDITKTDLTIQASLGLSTPIIKTPPNSIPGEAPMGTDFINVACMSSCKKINFGFPYGFNQSEATTPTVWYCCPTPLPPGQTCPDTGCTTSTVPICTNISGGSGGSFCCGPDCLAVDGQGNPTSVANGPASANFTGCVCSNVCNAGPVATSDYVEQIHNDAPGIYAFAYDDSQGLYQCDPPAGSTVTTAVYEFIFGPEGAASTEKWNTKYAQVTGTSS